MTWKLGAFWSLCFGCCFTLSFGLSENTFAAEPLACMSVGDLKTVALDKVRLQASEKNLKEQVKAYLELDAIRKEKEAVQEQHITDQDEIIDAQTVVLTREQRLSRYKSEFVGLAAAVALAFWVVN